MSQQVNQLPGGWVAGQYAPGRVLGRCHRDSGGQVVGIGRIARIESRGGVLRSGQPRQVVILAGGGEQGLNGRGRLWTREGA